MSENKFQDFGYDAVIPFHLILNQEVEGNAKSLYCVLRRLSGRDGICTATNAYLAATFDVAERTIKRWIASLEEHKYIKVECTDSFIKQRFIEIVDDFKKVLRRDISGNSARGQKCHLKEETKKEEEEKENNNKEKEDPPDGGGDPGGSQVFSSNSEVKKKPKKPSKPTSPESKKLGKMIWDHVQSLCPDATPPRFAFIWERQLDKLNLEQNRSWEEIEAMINFMKAHEFWKTTLCSPTDLIRLWNKVAIQKRNQPVALDTAISRFKALPVDYLEGIGVDVATKYLGFKYGTSKYETVNYIDKDFQSKVIFHVQRIGGNPARVFQ